jgi:hypothetical protein
VDVSVANATAGILAGYQALNGTCSECTYIDCSFSTCTFGLRIILQNALNHAVYGGSVSNCTTGLSNITSGLAVVNNVAFALNTTDIETNSAAQAMAVVGGRTEQNVTTSILVEACQAYVSGFTYESTATLIDASTSGSVVLDGCNFAGGSGVIAALGSTGLVIMDNMVSAVGTSTITGTAGSKLYLRGCQFGNANTITGFGGTVAQNI